MEQRGVRTKDRQRVTTRELVAQEYSVDQTLRRLGLRVSRARPVLLPVLAQVDGHLTVDSIADQLKCAGEDIGTATVYQNLSTLAAKGLVVRFLDAHGLARFDWDTSPHAHILCTSCGRVDNLSLPDGVRIDIETLSADSWQLNAGQLHVFGLCPDCCATTP